MQPDNKQNPNIVTPQNNMNDTDNNVASDNVNNTVVRGGSIKDNYETLMLVAALITIFSLLIGNGTILKIGAILFLILAIYNILSGSKKNLKVSTDESVEIKSQSSSVENKSKQTSLLKVFGIIALVIILLPVGGYLLLIFLAILLFSFGGADMGT